MSHHIVQTASAQMPSSVRHPYRRVAVLELEDGVERAVLGIRPTGPGVVRVVVTWERLNVGTTARSAYGRALAEATALAARLNRDAGASGACHVCGSEAPRTASGEHNGCAACGAAPAAAAVA